MFIHIYIYIYIIYYDLGESIHLRLHPKMDGSRWSYQRARTPVRVPRRITDCNPAGGRSKRARIHAFFRLINGRSGHGFTRKNCGKNWDEMDLTLNTIKNPGVQIVGSPSRSLELVATLSGALYVESALFPPQGILLLHRGRGFESVQRCSKARVNSKEKVAWSERSVRTWLELFRV